MPFRDYRCTNCKEVKEFHESINYDKTRICGCGGVMRRIITSPPSFGFKKSVGLNLSATERRRRWNSKDNREKV